MRFPVVFYWFLFIILLVIGCRKPLTPNIDRNQAPETWISAAPQDTITLRGPDGAPDPNVGQVATIAVRFHLYWAGSDQDGAVAGFYYAVVETLPLPLPGFTRPPPLPGPKASDYRFTTRSDSTFIFRVSEFSPDRQHAFYIYAVDNQGKADPTPARVIFNALDNFPPLPIIVEAKATGPVYRLLSGGVVSSETRTVFITDSLTRDNFAFPPEDTVPLGARLDFTWRGEPTIAGAHVAGYCYKLDEPRFICVDSSVHSVSYNTGAGDEIRQGSKVFTLRAVDNAGGVREVNRRFQVNYTPDTWFSGPDSSQFLRDPATGELYLDVPSWAALPGLANSLLGCDSITTWPAERPERKTFLEIYKNRLYLRRENETVHLNSIVILHSGGTDLDSPYDVHVSPNDPELPDTTQCVNPPKALRPGPPNGSPVGFHHQYTIVLDPGRTTTSTPSQSGLYPIFDPVSPFRNAAMAGYEPFQQSGRVYVVARAEDGTGRVFGLDQRIPIGAQSARLLADLVDGGGGTPYQRSLRSKIFAFQVNKPPRLLVSAGAFHPRPNETYTPPVLTFNLLADDDDPLDPETRPPGPGGPSLNKVLRLRVQVRGRDASGNAVTYPSHADSVFSPLVTVLRPGNVVSVVDTVKVELCDCATCELSPGSGRCVYYDLPINITPSPPPPGLATSAGTRGQPGPGPPNREIRSGTP